MCTTSTILQNLTLTIYLPLPVNFILPSYVFMILAFFCSNNFLCISYKAGGMVMSSFSSCLGKSISLKDSFASYRIHGWQVLFSLNIWNITSHCLLAWNILVEKSFDTLMRRDFLVCNFSPFSYCFQNYLFLTFENLSYAPHDISVNSRPQWTCNSE